MHSLIWMNSLTSRLEKFHRLETNALQFSYLEQSTDVKNIANCDKDSEIKLTLTSVYVKYF